MGLPLELGVFTSPGEEKPGEIRLLCDWLVTSSSRSTECCCSKARGFAIGGRATTGRKARAYRDAIAAVRPAVPVVSGTDQFFAELNRDWPELAGVDGVSYTINPQVHAADDESLMENVWGQLDTVRTARAHAGGRPVHAGSIVLLGKFGPYPGGVPDVPQPIGPRRPPAADPLRRRLDGRVAERAGAGRDRLGHVLRARRSARADRACEPCRRPRGHTGVPRPRGGRRLPGGSWSASAGGPSGRSVGLGMEWPERFELLVANLDPEPHRLGPPGSPRR